MRNELLQQALPSDNFPPRAWKEPKNLAAGGRRRGVMARLDRAPEDGCFCGLRGGGGETQRVTVGRRPRRGKLGSTTFGSGRDRVT